MLARSAANQTDIHGTMIYGGTINSKIPFLSARYSPCSLALRFFPLSRPSPISFSLSFFSSRFRPLFFPGRVRPPERQRDPRWNLHF